ncbi:MAG TPA: hypothetical protein VGD23_00685 [Sphingomicrobium sp.]
MLNRATTLLVIVPALWISGCERAKVNLRSLVGDGSLAAVMSHPSETIRVSLVDLGGDQTRNLDLVLGPDRTLAVTRYRLEWTDNETGRPKPIVEAEEKLRLYSYQSDEFRRRLSVFRPESLSQDGPFVLPRECNFISDGSSKAVVAFSDAQNRVGLFILQAGCNNANAGQLEAELRDVVGRLPHTRTAEPFIW